MEKDNVKLWLEEHKFELLPEEPIDENILIDFEKMKNSGKWPVPKKLPNMGVFEHIDSVGDFDKIIGNKNNWNILLYRTDIYKLWIIPKASILFGKYWFDKYKWKNTFRKYQNVSLFSEYEKEVSKKTGIPLEQTNSGKSKIIRIVYRIHHALDVYINGGGEKNGIIKIPSGYIKNAIKNEFFNEIKRENGYKPKLIPICPSCAISNGKRKIVKVLEISKGIYKCEKCSSIESYVYDEQGNLKNKNLIKEKREKAELFSRFEGTMCICPSDKCKGFFVPIRSIENKEWWKTKDGVKANRFIENMNHYKGSNKFRMPQGELLDLPLKCPYCGEKFTPREALKKHSGFKNNSGMFTGIPLSSIWVNESFHVDFINDIAISHEDLTNVILHKQRANILIDEIFLNLYRLGNTVQAFITKQFYLSVKSWIENYPEDASKYFFEWVTNDAALRGKETSIHQNIFYKWVERLSIHMKTISRMKGSKIKKLNDIKWINDSPTIFAGIVNDDFSVVMKNDLRLVRVLNLFHGKEDLSRYIESYKWRSFEIGVESNCGLSNGKWYVDYHDKGDIQHKVFKSKKQAKEWLAANAEKRLPSLEKALGYWQRIILREFILMEDFINKMKIGNVMKF